MSTEKKLICPYSQKECIKDGTIVVVDNKAELHTCPKWMKVVGKHPQTGQDIDQWNCADMWIPILLIENTQKQREIGAAIESFRNVMHTDMTVALSRTELLPQQPEYKLIESD